MDPTSLASHSWKSVSISMSQLACRPHFVERLHNESITISFPNPCCNMKTFTRCRFWRNNTSTTSPTTIFEVSTMKGILNAHREFHYRREKVVILIIIIIKVFSQLHWSLCYMNFPLPFHFQIGCTSSSDISNNADVAIRVDIVPFVQIQSGSSKWSSGSALLGD